MLQNLRSERDAYDTLSWIQEGTTVLDRDNHKIGKVKRVQFADGYDAEPYDMPDSFYRLHSDTQRQLMREGFIQIDGGFFAAHDRFATPEQVAGMTDEGLCLNVPEYRLIKA